MNHTQHIQGITDTQSYPSHVQKYTDTSHTAAAPYNIHTYMQGHSTGTNSAHGDAPRQTHTVHTMSSKVTKATLPHHSHTSPRGTCNPRRGAKHKDTHTHAGEIARPTLPRARPLPQKIHHRRLFHIFILWSLSLLGAGRCSLRCTHVTFYSSQQPSDTGTVIAPSHRWGN